MKEYIWEQYGEQNTFMADGIKNEDRWTLYLYDKYGQVHPMPKYKIVSIDGEPYSTDEEKAVLRNEIFGMIKGMEF